MTRRTRTVETTRQAHARFVAWARALGLAVRREPEWLAGDVRGWCVPLNGGRGWLLDEGPSRVGVVYIGSPRQIAPVLAVVRTFPGWCEQTHAADGFMGSIKVGAWSAAFALALRPRRSPQAPRRTGKPGSFGGAPALKRPGRPKDGGTTAAPEPPQTPGGSGGATDTASGARSVALTVDPPTKAERPTPGQPNGAPSCT